MISPPLLLPKKDCRSVGGGSNQNGTNSSSVTNLCARLQCHALKFGLVMTPSCQYRWGSAIMLHNSSQGPRCGTLLPGQGQVLRSGCHAPHLFKNWEGQGNALLPHSLAPMRTNFVWRILTRFFMCIDKFLVKWRLEEKRDQRFQVQYMQEVLAWWKSVRTTVHKFNLRKQLRNF